MLAKIQETAEYIRSKVGAMPDTAIILGTGLGALVDHIEDKKYIPYTEIPNFPVSTVEGHSGNLIFGRLGSKPVMAMQGRFHYYEGYDMKQVTFPVRVMRELGIMTLFVSNAAGGMNKEFRVGDVMIITDHINLFPENPLRGKNDNRPVINRILQERTQKAKLLGFKDFASYSTDNVMAKTTEAAEDLLLEIWTPAINRVAEEVKEMQALADRNGDKIKIEPWDYYYYAEKVRKDKYDLDEGEVRSYFSLDNVRKGIFSMAERLYGIKFTEMPDAPKYNPEVTVYDVTDLKGNHVAVFMTDYFPRASKRQGAWMSEFQGAFKDPDGKTQRPIVFNVGNFSKPTGDTPALLTLDEVETMFHEFGHGLHGMLTQASLRSQAGTNVDRDFVELPSQIHEHWALEPELLKTYARHYKTGEVIPDALVKKLQESSTHNQGFTTTELVGAALLDLQYGKLNPEGDIDVSAFEADVAKTLAMPETVQFRYRSPYFRHVFGSDGYSSGYYTYLWAEVLDTDGFELFKEKGIFDPATAKRFKETVLESGGSVDPMDLYVKFRGHRPSVDALLRNRGLEPVKKPLKSSDLKQVGGK
jgi:peptidyl-dipeptidase Dcp